MKSNTICMASPDKISSIGTRVTFDVAEIRWAMMNYNHWWTASKLLDDSTDAALLSDAMLYCFEEMW